MKSIVALTVALVFLSLTAVAQKDGDGKSTAESFGKVIPDLLERSDTPGMSIGVLREGKLVWTGSFGVKSKKTEDAVEADTIFEAASLTKPVTAYAALKLVDKGKLDLDKPLNEYLGNDYDVGDDPRLKMITARRVLSHTSGFPNWRRRGSKTLPINFTPGEKFSYSGEGFVYLSKVIEKIVGIPFEELVATEVFGPLGMKHSSLVWKEEFGSEKAENHDTLAEPKGLNDDIKANAAASLHTTAGDYARFVSALLKGKGLEPSTAKQMLTPQIRVDPEDETALAWGLGIGLEVVDGKKAFWHWGDNGWNRAFVIADAESGDGFVMFANGTNGLSFLREILSIGLPGRHPSEAWLGYERFDSVGRTLFKAILAEGAGSALERYDSTKGSTETGGLSERQMNRLGYDLLRLKRTEDAIVIFERNTRDHPESANVWDSLAEAYLTAGKKEKAIEFYRKSLALDPENTNAAEKIKEIEEAN